MLVYCNVRCDRRCYPDRWWLFSFLVGKLPTIFINFTPLLTHTMISDVILSKCPELRWSLECGYYS